MRKLIKNRKGVLWKARLKTAVIFLLAVCFLLPACKRTGKNSRTFLAMDTVMDISVYGDAAALDKAENLITALEKALSVTDGKSEIHALNSAGSAAVSETALDIIRSALTLAERTRGAFDPTVYPLVRAWGFTTGEHRVPDEAEITALLKKIDYRKVALSGSTVTLPEGGMLDLGGIAKGCAADRIVELFRKEGVKSALINLGGNVQTLGKKPGGEDWNIAVNDPCGGYALILSAADCAVVTSGGYERNFTENGVTYCHIIDPSTGRPAESGLLSVTVVAESGTTADALSTALYVMGLEKGVEFYRSSDDFEAVFITADGEMYLTEGLSDRYSAKGRFENAEINVIKRGE